MSNDIVYDIVRSCYTWTNPSVGIRSLDSRCRMSCDLNAIKCACHSCDRCLSLPCDLKTLRLMYFLKIYAKPFAVLANFRWRNQWLWSSREPLPSLHFVMCLFISPKSPYSAASTCHWRFGKRWGGAKICQHMGLLLQYNSLAMHRWTIMALYLSSLVI